PVVNKGRFGGPENYPNVALSPKGARNRRNEILNAMKRLPHGSGIERIESEKGVKGQVGNQTTIQRGANE
ncbi:hypothetical protein ABTJ92_20230, partial [Acinetobacter baumannii]